MVGLEAISRNAENFDIALLKLLSASRYFAQLGGTDGGEVIRVREENGL